MDRDRWNPEPAGRAAEVLRQRLRSSSPTEATARHQWLTDAATHLETAARRDPANGYWDHELGELWQTAAAAMISPPDASEALTHFERACRKSPTNAFWMADAAEAAHQAAQSEQAARWAARALEQDDLNRQLGHVERWLPDERRQQLEAWR